MRAVLQRVSSARVTVAGETTGEIGPGLLVLLGVQAGDTEDDARWLAGKLAALRLFEDAAGKMNRSLLEAGPAASDGAPAPTMLVVSQFTLLASTRQGARPSFSAAAPPDAAGVNVSTPSATVQVSPPAARTRSARNAAGSRSNAR